MRISKSIKNNKVIVHRRMKKNVVSPFIEMIWELVSDPNTDHIITWGPYGISFCITDARLFADGILTTNFKHGNISSFVRQLNMYNFHKNKANTKDLEFFHKLFRRDAWELLIGIKRKPSEADQKEGQELLQKYLHSRATPIKFDHEGLQENHRERSVWSPNPTVDSLFIPPLGALSSFSRKLSYAFTSETENPNSTNNEFQLPLLNILQSQNKSLQKGSLQKSPSASLTSSFSIDVSNQLNFNLMNFISKDTSALRKSLNFKKNDEFTKLQKTSQVVKKFWNNHQKTNQNIAPELFKTHSQATEYPGRKFANIILIIRPEDY